MKQQHFGIERGYVSYIRSGQDTKKELAPNLIETYKLYACLCRYMQDYIRDTGTKDKASTKGRGAAADDLDRESTVCTRREGVFVSIEY
jgi:hypothetical protein